MGFPAASFEDSNALSVAQIQGKRKRFLLQNRRFFTPPRFHKSLARNIFRESLRAKSLSFCKVWPPRLRKTSGFALRSVVAFFTNSEASTYSHARSYNNGKENAVTIFGHACRPISTRRPIPILFRIPKRLVSLLDLSLPKINAPHLRQYLHTSRQPQLDNRPPWRWSWRWSWRVGCTQSWGFPGRKIACFEVRCRVSCSHANTRMQTRGWGMKFVLLVILHISNKQVSHYLE